MPVGKAGDQIKPAAQVVGTGTDQIKCRSGHLVFRWLVRVSASDSEVNTQPGAAFIFARLADIRRDEELNMPTGAERKKWLAERLAS